MASFGSYSGYAYSSTSQASDIQNYRPGEFLRRFDEQKDTHTPYLSPHILNPDPTLFKDSFIGGLNSLNSYNDDFYKSQVMERSLGGEPVYLNAVNHYKPLTGTEDTRTMDEIRSEHIKIMDKKLNEAVSHNGNNAYQTVKTIIVEPVNEVVDVRISNAQEGYHGAIRRSSAGTTTVSGQVSGVSYSPIPNLNYQKRNSQVQGTSQVTIQGAPPTQGRSRIQYIPYERKVTQLQTREWVEKVPVTRTIVEYEERKMVEQVPVEKTVLDYYAVQHVIQYEPRVIEEKIIEMVPVETTEYVTSYIPIEQQIMHTTTQTGKKESRVVYQGPPTPEGEAVKGQSRIKYIPPLVKTNNNSRVSYENPGITYQNPQILYDNQGIPTIPFSQMPPLEKKMSRASAGLPKQNSFNNLPNLPNIPNIPKQQKPNVVRKEQVYQDNVIDINVQPYDYWRGSEEPSIPYIPNPTPVYPISTQNHQMRMVQDNLFPQYNNTQPYTNQYNTQYNQPIPLYNPSIPQYSQPIQYIPPSNYPLPSQVQTVYQIHNPNPIVEVPTYHINTKNLQNPPLMSPRNQSDRFSFNQHPQEVVFKEEKKTMRRQNSGISLTR